MQNTPRGANISGQMRTKSSPAVRRPSGRRPDQMRPVAFEAGYTTHPGGSVLARFGETRVLCTANVEAGVPHFLRGSGRGWVTAEYGMLPGATHTRSRREASSGRQSGRTMEIQRLNRTLAARLRGFRSAARTYDRRRLRCHTGRRGDAYRGNIRGLAGPEPGLPAALMAAQVCPLPAARPGGGCFSRAVSRP